MKRTLLRTFLFLLPLLALGGVAESLVRAIPNELRTKYRALDRAIDSTQVLILGSSHALYGIDPAYLDAPAFNAASVSQSLDIDAAVLKIYLARAPALRKVVVVVNYSSTGHILGKSAERWRIKNYVLYTPLKIRHDFRHNFEVLNHPLPDLTERIWKYYGKEEFPRLRTRPNGFSTHYQDTLGKNLNAEAAALAVARHTNHDEQAFRLARAAIDTMERLCRDAGIEFYLISTPHHPSYTNGLDPEQLKRLETLKTGRPDLPYGSHNYDLAGQDAYTDADFRDPDHLNSRGAAKFTRRLNKLLQ